MPGTARLLAPLTAHEAPAVLSPHPDDAAWLQQTALQLLDEHRALGRRPLDVHHALRRSLLESLLLRLADSPDIAPIGTATAGGGPAARYGRFLDALELHFRELHQAADYAELLGCSVRTLSRAAQDATGKGVRELINERRLLEARRLLGGARWDARTVAAHLGFTDPANFGRFFRDRTGLTPAAFATREAPPVPLLSSVEDAGVRDGPRRARPRKPVERSAGTAAGFSVRTRWAAIAVMSALAVQFSAC
jgi:AraC-like DNA-binding protein